ncbi:CocE/NonD family hydrolase [Phytohabitans kaempferiae]|uniref:CocE/NonD family hydrolase n=1 Tax=Phytohabitans kaempferiae TaxID=1620943 RepID=A0ABV6MHL0_9ACTN
MSAVHEAVSASSGRAPYGVSVLRDVRIPTEDPAVTLSADLFLPVGAAAVPALVMLLPYRKDAVWGIRDTATFRWYARHGYASVVVDFRGCGSSDGLQRPPFDSGEAFDGVAAVEWAAKQPWCSGNVGMWGPSYGAVTSLRTASRQPPSLKAIMPIVGMTDPERDFVHPSGMRGMGSIASWGSQQLLYQLLPPLREYHSAVEQQRWLSRMHAAEPWVLDLVRRGPGDPEWRLRAIEASNVTVPAFCIGGWRDFFLEGTFRAYEQIDAPKKLLVGPWMHDLPDAQPVEPVNFRQLSLRWWDYWLNGVDNGVMDEPAVTLYLQGDKPRWHQFPSWPPTQDEVRLATAGNTALVRLADNETGGDPSGIIGEAPMDPTVGILSGLSTAPGGGSGRALDQHDDDMRSLTCTSEALTDALVIAGRPRVALRLEKGRSPARVAIRLAEVDPRGSSNLIGAGEVAHPGTACTVTLTPTYHEVAAGNRLRVVVSDADFPRLWPVSGAAEGGHRLRVAAAELNLPVVSDPVSVEVSLPAPEQAAPESSGVALQRPSWTLTRDHVNDTVKVSVAHEMVAPTPESRHLLEIYKDMTASVNRRNPSAAVARGTASAIARLTSGETVDVRASLQITGAALSADAEIHVDGLTVFSRRWDLAVPGPTPEAPGE